MRKRHKTACARETLAIVFTNQNDNLEKLSRYEVAIERSFYRALCELQRLQASRKDRDVGTPAVIDVQPTPAG